MTKRLRGSWAALPCACLALAAAAPPLQAAEPPPNDRVQGLMEDEFGAIGIFERFTKLRPRVRLTHQSTFRQRFSKGGSDTRVDRHTTGLRMSVLVPLNSKFAIRAILAADATAFEFHGPRDFLDTGGAAAGPFDELFSNQLRLEARYLLANDWSIVAGSSFSSRWEAHASYRKGIAGSGFVGVGHMFWDRLSIIGGLSVGSRVGGTGASYSPLIRVGWKVTDRIEVQNEGYGIKLVAKLKPSLALNIRAGLKSARYRLDDRGGVFGEGVLRDKRLPVLVGLDWKITKQLRFRGSVGAVAYQKYQFVDGAADNTSEKSKRPAFTGHMQLDYRF